ncbi:unnamed protein product [Didymodactylos carnosus]|uniref:MAM domain-containing protein n=1 Tax=Didymodactylos carnosus TaxID=1234261 RepID=A0A8S2EX12_9BILA|nr:unnamed protein product [Didymodactylos carnosus]CAF4099079.1 unnamed protein product [Didymodactylos carnosus]
MNISGTGTQCLRYYYYFTNSNEIQRITVKLDTDGNSSIIDEVTSIPRNGRIEENKTFDSTTPSGYRLIFEMAQQTGTGIYYTAIDEISVSLGSCRTSTVPITTTTPVEANYGILIGIPVSFGLLVLAIAIIGGLIYYSKVENKNAVHPESGTPLKAIVKQDDSDRLKATVDQDDSERSKATVDQDDSDRLKATVDQDDSDRLKATVDQDDSDRLKATVEQDGAELSWLPTPNQPIDTLGSSGVN